MKTFIATTIIASLFSFCLIPLSFWFHSISLVLSLEGIEDTIGGLIYDTMISIYVVSFAYFVFSAVIYLINNYRLNKNLEPMMKRIKVLYFLNYFMLVINLFLPLIIGKIAYPNFNYNFTIFIFGNAATLLDVSLLQIAYGDIFRKLFSTKWLEVTIETGQK